MVDAMIRLFDSASSTFVTNGLGSLPDAITCKVTEERNGSFELEMTYPITGKRYSDLALRKIIVAKSNPYSAPQPFRIYSITKPINGIVTINAEHISYDLSGYPVAPFEAGTIGDAFVRMKAASAVTCPFTFWTDKTTVAAMKTLKPYSMRSLLGGMSGSFLDIYGGEYEFDGYSVKLWNNRGANRGVSIRYGKNLTDLNQEENCSNVYTGVYPFWYSEEDGLVALAEKFINAPGTYDFVRIYALDLTDKFQEKPTETQLRNQAESYIKSNNIGVPKVSLTVSFVQLAQSEEYKNVALLETVHLCDTVNVEFPELGVSGTAKCITTVYDVLTDKYESIELGEAKSNLSSAIASQNQSVKDKFDEQKTSLQKSIDNATQLITGGLGGYVVIRSSTGGKKPDEILIMDTDDIRTAKEVWRWNKGGLGYSKTGYAGPFTTAITQDGKIVADFITAGEFDGAIIKAGSIAANMLSVDYRNSVKEYADSVGEDVYSDCEVLIQSTADAIKLLVTEEVTRAQGAETELSAALKIASDNIAAEVTRAGSAEATLKSSIEATAESITTKVAKDDFSSYMEQYYNAVIIGFNNSSKYVQFGAGNIEVYDAAITNQKLRARMDQAGYHFWRDGYEVGKIGTNVISGNEDKKGLVFDLEADGTYMTWASKQSSSQSTYTLRWTYVQKGKAWTGMSEDALNAGCDIDMRGYKLKNVAWPTPGITGTLNFVQVAEMLSDGKVSRWYNDCKLQFQNGLLISGTWGND